jgi:hypothetical protein
MSLQQEHAAYALYALLHHCTRMSCTAPTSAYAHVIQLANVMLGYVHMSQRRTT